MTEYLVENKEWIFSGAGIAIVSAGVYLLRKIGRQTPSMKQESGDGSLNIQVGGSINDSEIKK
ncbi:hypothetical protein [Leisingera sp. ANG-M6]|uniref:hypothetical protein n=1 Tax=Leisingera sp. ANG-M6 TaxID=1577900 RepID=UPI00126A4C87|nr:hypothetical protein [Leisingera sp. ANG-M6]